MIDVFKKLQKKRNYCFPGGGGGGGGRARVCQVNVTRKVFKIWNFVFGNLSFFFRSPLQYHLFATKRKTGVAKLDPWSKS